MTRISIQCEERIRELEKFPVETLLPEAWRDSMKGFLTSCNNDLCEAFAQSMQGKMKIPAQYGYSISDMALGIAPMTTGQAIVFFRIMGIVDEYFRVLLEAGNGSE